MNSPSMWHIFEDNEYNMLPTSSENIYHDQKGMNTIVSENLLWVEHETFFNI